MHPEVARATLSRLARRHGRGLGQPGRSDAGVVVVLVLNRFRCSTSSLQNYSIVALSFLRNCGKKRYSAARFPYPSSSTARARPREATGQPLYRSHAQKDACMTNKISILKRRSGGSMAYVVTFGRVMATGRDMDPLTWL